MDRLLCVAIGALSCTSCGDSTADMASKEQILLDSAVQALWGSVAPESIVASRTVSTYIHSDRHFELQTYVKTPDCYREVRQAYGITEVHAVRGEMAWTTVDDVLLPLDDSSLRRLKTQTWLFNTAKLTPLRDAARFKLSHKGRAVLEDGSAVLRLEVTPKDVDGIQMTFDFHEGSHLLRRVELRHLATNEVQTLFLDDYRAVQDVQVPHVSESWRNGKPYAKAIVKEVRFNENLGDALFDKPEQPAGDPIIDKESVGGFVACAPFDGDVAESVDELKVWISENKLEVAGPLVITSFAPADSTRSEPPKAYACIPVSALPEGATPTERPGFVFHQIERRRALCTTRIGATETPAIMAQLREQAKELGLTPAGATLEIYFSPNGHLRQVQMPVE